MTDEELLSCAICGLESNNLNTHIVRIHKMSIDDYKAQYPGVATCRLRSDQIEKMRETKRAKGNKRAHALVETERQRDEMLTNGIQLLECAMCGKTSTSSLISHIVHKHNITMQEYRATFPSRRVQQVSLTQRINNSHAMKEKLSNPIVREAFLQWRSFPSEIKHWIRKGFDLKEAQEKVAEFQRRQSNKGNNEKTSALRSQKMSGSNNPMSLASIAKRNGVTEQ